MLQIEFAPDLAHCIETLARKEYNGIVRQLLVSVKVKGKLREKAELLKSFLEIANFKKLRGESERHLFEGRHVKFLIYADGGVPKYEMRISPEP